MSLPHAVLDFDETGIISPVGYNDSGKSAITRSLEVLWFDAYPNLQSKFITDGKPSFVIINRFDDGVLVQRTKFANGSSHWLMTQNNVAVYDNKLPSGSYAAVKGVPDVIKTYLGVAQDEATGETLNIRRNTNKLFLIGTTGGENYKIFNNLCKGDKLAYATGALNADINLKNRNLTAQLSRLQGKKEVLSGTRVFPLETEQNITRLSTLLSDKATQLEALATIGVSRDKFAHKRVIAPIRISDLTQLRVLLSLREKLNSSRLHVRDLIPLIDTSRLKTLYRIRELARQSSVKILPSVPATDTSRLKQLLRLQELSNLIQSLTEGITQKSQWLKIEREALTNIAAEHNLHICPNCGATLDNHTKCVEVN